MSDQVIIDDGIDVGMNYLLEVISLDQKDIIIYKNILSDPPIPFLF